MKNIVLIMGSPRKNGNTEILSNAFIDGAKSSGNNVKIINAAQKKIKPCIGCNKCFDDGNVCIQNDDMQECYKILSKADVLVIATPIYYYNVTAQLKCFIDRLHNPIRNTFNVQKLGLLAVCADTKNSVFNSVKEMYFSVLEHFSLENAGIITVCGVKDIGDIINNSLLEDAKNMGKTI